MSQKREIGATVPCSKGRFLDSIYAPIQADLAQVDRILIEQLDRSIPWMDKLLGHTNITGGKRMRPALLLFSALACGEIGVQHHQLAAALEMIHTASLIHDDVLDHAVQRRHVETVNSQWDNKTSVLLGDYLFTHAFHLASQIDSLAAIRRLAVASNRVCGGEMKQNAWSGDFDISEVEYLQMVSEKTAELCSCACYCGAHLSAASDPISEAFSQFGQNLGIAFQIIDDILDLVGETETVGKTLGTDLKNRKPTLPVIHSLSQADSALRQTMVAELVSEHPDHGRVMSWLESTGSLQYAKSRARQCAQSAVDFTVDLSDGVGSESLKLMAQFVLERTF